MAREIVATADIIKLNQTETAPKLPGDSVSYPSVKDSYFDRLFKYIPAEIVAGYIFVLGLMEQLTEPDETRVLQWTVFAVFCLLTPFYLWRVQKVKKLQQHIISVLSFVVWVAALGGPFSQLEWYKQIYGEILLPVFTLTAAIWEAE